jgi:Tol biopolymer transport system component
MIRPNSQFGKSGLAHRLRAKHPQQRWACASFATLVFVIAVLVLDFSQAGAQDFKREVKIAFSSSRDNPTLNPFLVAEIYLMDPDGSNPIRMTEDTGGANVFAALSPDGKKIVFDSNRRTTDIFNTIPRGTFVSDLFVMNTDGTEQTLLTRGSAATWAPDSKNIAFHASASGTGLPIRRNEPGATTSDSDIFVANVDDVLKGVRPKNITNSPDKREDDADWSPDGQKIVFTSHPVKDENEMDENPNHPIHAEIYVMNADGTGRVQLTNNLVEERAPAWSPDGTRILFMCRIGPPPPTGTIPTFEICVMSADGSNLTRLTDNAVADLTPTWSPDGQKITVHRPVAGLAQLFVMNADGTVQLQLTSPPGQNAIARWGEVLIPGAPAAP